MNENSRLSPDVRRALVAALLAVAIPTGVGGAHAEPADYEVGLAKVDVTPRFPIRLSGFSSRKEESGGIRQPLFARAMAIRAGGEPAVLITVDSIGIPRDLYQEVARRLQKKRNIRTERIAVCSTHSHTAPALQGILPTMFGAPVPTEHQQRIDRYTAELTDLVEQAASAALDDLKPSQISFGVGNAGFAINRRTRGGPVDHNLPLMCISTPGGTIRGLYVNYACHCVVLRDNKISGDWAGYAAEELERRHAGAVALVSIGCGADSNPDARVATAQEDNGAIAQQYGSEISSEADRLLQTELVKVTGNLQCVAEEITLPLQQLPTREEWVEKAKDQSVDGYYAQVQVDALDRGETLPTEVPYSIQTWKFGDSLAMVFLPGEVVVDYSLRLKTEFDATRLWINAYANDLPAYIPSERILKEGGYEAGLAMHFYGLPAWFAPGIEEKIVSTIGRQLGDRFKTAGQSTKSVRRAPPPKSPQESLATIQVRPDMRVELMASEPMVSDPVAIDFGPDGKLWVAEMHDYGCKDGEDCPPMGRITVLEDRDADGRFDSSTPFLENISCPMGVTVWRNGVLVCAAPDVLYAEDSDGDGKADVVKKLFSGFGTQHPQARVNGFAYGLDGWLYAACSFGGAIENHITGDKATVPDRDLRLKPDDGALESESGRTQQSRARDDWGNWFGCHNSTLCFNYPLAERYLRRNPLVIPPNLAVDVASAPAALLFPRGELVLFDLSGPPGKATAACGLGVYRDEVLGPSFTNNVFACEAVNQLVHRMVLEPNGATFTGVRAADEAESEFLTSTDNWFRPVQVRAGPDGGLWVVDMYRYVIEHSRWIPKADLEQLDLRAGSNRGRIYRVMPKDVQPRPFRRLDNLPTAELAAAMESPNGWQRDMVQQLLVWRADDTAVAPLERLTADSPQGATRLQAMCTLNVLGHLRDELIVAALADEHPAVRRQAIRLAESRANDSSALAEAILSAADESDAATALQLACSLGEINDSRKVEALSRIVGQHASDPYIIAGALSSLKTNETARFVTAALGKDSATTPRGLFEKIMEYAGAVDDAQTVHTAIDKAIALATRPGDHRFAAAAALVTGVHRSSAGKKYVRSAASASQFEKLCDECAGIALDAEAELVTRLDCVRILGRHPRPVVEHVHALGSLLTAAQDLALQTTALQALSQRSDETVAMELLDRWSGYTPALREQVLGVLMNRTPWVRELVDAVGRRVVQASEVDAAHRAQLLEHPDKEIRQLAAKHFSQLSTGERTAVVERYASLPGGDAARGKGIFEKNCAMCHRFGDIGEEVGPDLAALKDKSREALVSEILDPNRALDQRYAEYLALTVDGQAKKGILVEETAGAITLRGQKREEFKLLRSELESFTTVGKSLMPEGLENQISTQDMADLIEFLSGV